MDAAGERIQQLHALLEGEAMRVQVQAWGEQRDVLRATVKELWEQGQFVQWWQQTTQDIRTAMVMTALEDLPQHAALAPLGSLVCTELQSEVLLGDDGAGLVSLLQTVVAGRENNEDVHSFSPWTQHLDPSHVPSPASVHALRTARSCILLHFATAVLLVYQSFKEA